MAVKDGGPAFPTQHEESGFQQPWTESGMALRDYLAAHAPYMPDELLGDRLDAIERTTLKMDRTAAIARMFAAWAYEFADAMIAERERAQ